MTHLAEDAAVRAGDALDGEQRAVWVHGQVHAGHAGLVHVLRGDLSVGLEQVKHRFGGDEAAFTMRDGHGVHVAHGRARQPRRQVRRDTSVYQTALVTADRVERQRRAFGGHRHDVAIRNQTQLDERLEAVDAAIFSGLQQLGLSIDEVTINVIQHGTKGLLGIGAKPAIVELTEKPAEEVVVPDFTAELARERRERTERRGNRDNRSGRDNRENHDNRRREDRETVTAIAEGVEETRKEIIEPEIPETDMPVGTGTAAAEAYDENAKYDVPETVNRAEGEFAAKPERNEKYERNNRANRDSRGNRSRPQRQNREEEPAPEAVKEPPVNYTEEAAEGEPAAQFVTELIEKMGISGKVLAAREEDAIRLRIDSDTMGVLIGHRGETLDAIQYLTGLVINRNRKVDGYTRVTINTEDYREKREETLIRLARRVAAQVKSTGRPRTLEAMNPYERRILHSALQNNPYVTTHSEGEEPYRHVVVKLKRW